MGYTDRDLSAFELLTDRTALDGTAYFELHPGEIPEPFACWLDGSIFVKDAGFDFVVECFYKANPRFDYFSFDYFSFDRFDPGEIERLQVNLMAFGSTLVPGCSRDTIFSRYSSLFSPDIQILLPVLARHLERGQRARTASRSRGFSRRALGVRTQSAR